MHMLLHCWRDARTLLFGHECGVKTFLEITDLKIMSAGKGSSKIKYGENAPKIDKAQLEFMKLVEEQNFERATKLQQLRRKNLITAGALIGTVVGIYAYSILSVKQEKFLDDFDEPKKIIN